MGLETVFRSAAQAAFGIFADVAVSARYESVVTTTYDASSGVASVIRYSGMTTAIFETYDKRLVDGDRIKPQDVKALVLPIPLPTEPKTDDTLHVVESNCSVAYRVIDSSVDPAKALYTMQLRREG